MNMITIIETLLINSRTPKKSLSYLRFERSLKFAPDEKVPTVFTVLVANRFPVVAAKLLGTAQPIPWYEMFLYRNL